MNKNKAKCDFLKSVRKGVADKLGVDLHQVECTFQGTCTGTCPKCKQEEEILNKELIKRAAGFGVGALATLSLAGCGPINTPGDIQGGMTYKEPVEEHQLSGNVQVIPPDKDTEIDSEGDENSYCEPIENNSESEVEHRPEYDVGNDEDKEGQ